MQTPRSYIKNKILTWYLISKEFDLRIAYVLYMWTDKTYYSSVVTTLKLHQSIILILTINQKAMCNVEGVACSD